MKELIASILKAEESLNQETLESQNKARAVLDSAKQKAALVEKEFEAKFSQEKEQKNSSVLLNAKKQEEKLCEELKRDIQNKKEKLEAAKTEIKKQIINSIVGE
jgi:vacuolar-type H+-ATPase subunit H